MWIDDQFPRLASEGYQLTSEPSLDYNCIAYAAGYTDRWWTHTDGPEDEYYWPEFATRTPFIHSLIEVFAGLGYEPCESPDQETGYAKVALYVDEQGQWTHAAVQLPDGSWSSKLGPDEDIRHQTPESLIGASYGAVHCIMRRLGGT